MTERKPDEIDKQRLNEDDPEVEGHRVFMGPEEAVKQRVNEDADQDESGDDEGRIHY